MQKIFISYRREDSQDATGRIHDHLDIYLGRRIVFRDIDNLNAGDEFPLELEKALSHSKLVIVVIGRKWLDISDGTGRRLDNPADFVRQEITMALERKIPIIPVVVSGAHMPARADLPDPLKGLCNAHALHIPADTKFPQNVRLLSQDIAGRINVPFTDYLSTLHQCQDVGLTLVADDFHKDSTALHEMDNSRNLIVVQNDGRSWVDTNRERLLGRLKDKRKKTRVVLYHPRSEFLKILIKKNKKTLDRQISEIRSSFEILTSMPDTLDRIFVRGHHGFNPYSLLVSDNYAFVSPYHYHEAGRLSLLKFFAKSANPLYKTLREDAMRLFDMSTPLEIADFVN